MGQFVIAAYRPKRGKSKQLLKVLRDHMPVLRSQKLITKRPAYLMRAKDGTFIEVFEWKSAKAIEQALVNPVVLELWERFGKCCEYVALKELPEVNHPFPGFERVEMD